MRDRGIGDEIRRDRRSMPLHECDGLGDTADVGRHVGFLDAGWCEESVEEFFRMRDQYLPLLDLVFEPHRKDPVTDHRQAEPCTFFGESRERLGRKVDVDFDEIVAVRLRQPHEGARILRRPHDETAVIGRAIDEKTRIDMRPRQFAAIDRRYDLVDESGARVAHVEHGGHAVGEIDSEVVLGLRMRVHVGEAGRQPSRAVPVDARRGGRDVHIAADRDDAIAANEHGLIAQHAFAIHRHDVDVNERGRFRRLSIGVRAGRQAEQGDRQRDGETTHSEFSLTKTHRSMRADPLGFNRRAAEADTRDSRSRRGTHSRAARGNRRTGRDRRAEPGCRRECGRSRRHDCGNGTG